jgi:hypothetical protein
MKTALKAHLNNDWVLKLPLVLLGLRSHILPEVEATPAEMTYGTTIRLPGGFFEEQKPKPVRSRMREEAKNTPRRRELR